MAMLDMLSTDMREIPAAARQAPPGTPAHPRRYVKPTAGVSTLRDVFLRCSTTTVGGCWRWKGCLVRGRPMVWMFNLDLQEKTNTAGPRALWYLLHNQPVGERAVWMACGTRSCMCPQHVRTGTLSEYRRWLVGMGSEFGRRDADTLARLQRGRAMQGQIDTPAAVVMHIVHLKSLGLGNAEVSRQTGVHLTSIARIMSGRTHSHITGIKPAPSAKGRHARAA